MKLFGKKKAAMVAQETPWLADPFVELHGSLTRWTSGSWLEQEKLKEAIFHYLALAMATGDVGSPAAQYVAALHRKWICLFWREGMYTKDAHLMLANIYVAEPRFSAFYDGRVGRGAAQFLRDAIEIFLIRGGAVLDLPQNTPSVTASGRKALPDKATLEMEEMAEGIVALLHKKDKEG